MKYSSEVKVGLTLLVAAAIFVFGIRYFQDLPIFGSTDEYAVEFDDAGGLIAGNAVRINGVSVGGVKNVFFNPTTQRARVEFHINGNIDIPEGSFARVSGFSALGVVKLDVVLASLGGNIIPPGGELEGSESADIMATFSETAPQLLERADSVLASLNQVLVSTDAMISDPSASVQKSLSSFESIVAGLDESLKRDRESLSSILNNLESLTSNVDVLTGESQDSLTVLLENLNASVRRMDQTMASVDNLASNLADVVRKVNEGEGTLGRFINDPGIYENLDSTLLNLNALIQSFNEDPGRFMKEMRLIDLF